MPEVNDQHEAVLRPGSPKRELRKELGQDQSRNKNNNSKRIILITIMIIIVVTINIDKNDSSKNNNDVVEGIDVRIVWQGRVRVE